MKLLVSYEIYDVAGRKLAYGRDVVTEELSGDLPRYFSEKLKDLAEKKAMEVTLPPEKAYGRMDRNKIKVIPLKEFLANGVRPFPGLIVEINGKKAKVIAIARNRVTVDFNHFLAGKTLKFKVKVEKELKTEEELIKALFELHGITEGVEMKGDTVTVTGTPEKVNLEALAEDIKRYTGKTVKVMLRGEEDGEHDKGGSGESGKGR